MIVFLVPLTFSGLIFYFMIHAIFSKKEFYLGEKEYDPDESLRKFLEKNKN